MELEERLETGLEKYKYYLIGVGALIVIFYVYSNLKKGTSTSASTSSSPEILGGGGSSSSPASTDNPTYDSAIAGLQSAFTQLQSSVAAIVAPVASSLGITVNLSGQYDNSSEYSYGQGNNQGASGGSGGISLFGITIGGTGTSGGNSSQTTVQDVANNTKDETQSLQFNESGLAGTDLSDAENAFIALVQNAQTDVNSANAIPAWFAPQGNTTGSELVQNGSNLVYVQPGQGSNPNKIPIQNPNDYIGTNTPVVPIPNEPVWTW